ncbi:MAG: TonB-dependent receptor domain-containing protein, partial [Longimicrobiales bacterium]
VSWRRPLAAGELEFAAYGVLRSIDNPIPPAIIDLHRVAGGLRALYRNSTRLAGQELQWTVGSDLDFQRDDRKNYANLEGERGDLALDQRERVRGVGVFGQLSAPLTDRLSILASLRYDAFRFSADDHMIGPADPDDSGARDMDALNPSVGVTGSPAASIHMYAYYATSFQTPTTTELANRPSGAGGFNPTLEPERTRAFEVGARGRLGGIGVQLAAYRAVVEDALIGFEVPQAAGRTFFRNAGSAVHRGFEAGIGFAPVTSLDARLSYTYTDAKFRDYTVGDEVYDDNLLPGVAPHRLEGVVTYEPGAWFLELDGRYLSRTQANDANTASSPPYAVFDMRAGLVRTAVLGARITPFIGVSNVLDRDYNTSIAINAFGGRFFEPGPGRAFHAGASLVLGARN